jgi:uncharacterized OB-fold protein
VCRYCAGVLSFEPTSGKGTVFSFIVVRHVTTPGHDAPYTVAFIELDDAPGIRVTGVVRGACEAVAIGMPVVAVMVRLGDSDIYAPEFEPAPS